MGRFTTAPKIVTDSKGFGSKTSSDLSIPDRDQYAYVYDLLSEGPIEGLYAGASSIFLNDVPLIDTSAEEIVIARTTTLNTTASSTTVTSSLFDTINNLTYNNVTGMALGKRQIVIEKAGATASDASATKGSNVVTTSSSFFTAANSLRGVNNYITIEGAGDNGTDFRSKILTVTSATEVIIADNIATTVSNVNVHLDFVSTVSSISGSGASAQATLDDAVGVTLTNATCHVGGPVLGSKEMKSLYNFKDLNMVFRTGQRNSAVAPVKGVQGYASTVYTPNLKIDQNDLRQNVSSSIPTNYNLSEIGSGCSQNEGTAPDTVLTASAMGVSIPSETDQIDVTFKIPSSSATKGTGKRWPGFVEFQLFFEYSTDGGASYPADQRVLAFGPTTDQLLNRTPIEGRRINYWPTKGAIPNNGYIQPPEMTTTPFIEEFKMDVTRFQPFDDYRIRIRRITDNDFAEKPDDREKRVDRKTDLILQSVENHSTDKLRYPFSAIAGLAFNAGAFEGQIPPRSYLLKGRKIKVPTNYRTRDEVGTNEAKYDRNITTGATESSYQNWDGKFRGDKTEFGKGSVNYDEVYCNNPVWVYYDILTNERYGMGQFIDASQVDKYELFRLAKYCDELVSDGEGGTEPRFTTNVYLQKTTEATKVLNQLASVFRGMSIWADGQLSPVVDMPKQSVYTFTKGNVEDGLFQYEGTAERVRTNQIKVFWNDPNDNYRQSAEYVEDFQSIAETGRIIRSEQIAFGCTSRGQAHRLGKWKLLSEQNEKETVSFITSIAASGLRPGNIITVQDADRDRSTYSGRVTNFNPESGLTLDLTAGSGGAATQINGNSSTSGGFPFYTPAQQGANVVIAGEVNLPSSFSQDACMWEHGGSGTGSWLGVRDIGGTYNLTLRSGEGDSAITATSPDGIVSNIPISDIPEFDDQVHTVCWEFAPDATPATQRLWIDGKLYIDDETTSDALESGSWSGGNTGGWLEGFSTISGNYSANAWPVTTGSSGLRHYFGELVSSSVYGSSTTEIDLDRTISLPQNYSDNPHQLLLIYPRGGAYLQDETATIDSVTYYKGDLIPSISSSEDAANQDANIFWSENVRVEKQPLDTTVHSSAGNVSSITVSSAFTTPPDAETIWALQLFNSDGSEKTGTAKEYKVISIKESDDYKIEILAAAYFRNKFEQVERGHVLQARPAKTTPDFEDVIPSPQTVVVTVEPIDTESASSNERGVFTGHKAVISWDFPENSDGSRFDFVASFEVEHNLKARDSVELVRTGQQSLQVSPIIAGTYEIRVRTISTAGTPSQYFTQAVTITEQQLGIGNVSKVQEIPRGGSLNKSITINKSTGAVSISSPNYTFTSPEGTIHTPSTGSNNNTESFSDLTSGETGYLLFDASETSHQLKAIELVTDTSVSPPVNYAKEISVADGLENATGLVTVTALSNKISGNNFTAFSTEYAIGDLVLLQNGSSTTATVNGAVSNSTSVTLSASNSSIKVGQTVTGTGIVNENFVTAISGTSLTLNSPVTISDAITLTFTPQKKYGRVNYIESDTLMFMDRISERPYSGTAIRKQKFKPDFLNDSILATVSYDGTNYSIDENYVSTGETSAVFHYETSNTNSLSDSAFFDEFGRYPLEGDILIVVNTSSTPKSSASYRYEDGAFVSLTNFITGDLIIDGRIKSANHSGTLDGSGFSTAGTSINLPDGSISAKEFRIDSSGNAEFSGTLQAADGSFSGSVTAGTGSIGGWTIDTTSIFSGTKDVTDYTTTGITISSDSGGSIHAKEFYIDTSGNANFKGTIFGGSVRADVTNPIPTDIFTRSSSQSIPTGSENGAFIDLNAGKFVFGDANRFIAFSGSELDVKAVLAPTVLDLTSTAATTLPSTIKASAVSDGSIGVGAFSQAVWNEIDSRVGTGTGGFYTTATDNYLGEATKTISIATAPDHGTETVTLEVIINDSFGAPVSYSFGNTATAVDVTLQYKKTTDSTYTTAGSTQRFYANPTPLSYITVYTIDEAYSVDLTSGVGNDLENGTDYDFRVLLERVHSSLSVFAAYGGSGSSGANDSTGTPVVLEAREGSVGAGQGDLFTTEYLYHTGDADTHIQFQEDQIDIAVGGSNFATFQEGSQNTITLREDVIMSGNLTVEGTQTTLRTTVLDVEDKNITLNYSTGDSSASANGAGITIQDAVSQGNDATILWDTSNDEFDFSHPINVSGTITSSDNLTITGSDKQIKFTGTGGPYGFEFGDTENNPNFRIYYRTSPNSLTFEDNSESAKHTFTLEGDYTAARDLISSQVVRVGTSLVMGGGNAKSIDFTGTGTDTTARKFIYEQSGHHYITNRHTDGDLIFMSNNGTGGGETTRITLQSGSGTQDIDITNANLDMNSNNINNIGSLSDGTITITGFVDEDNMSSNSATLLPTQQSVKAYVDANAGSGGTTINNNANNRVITGSDTANTLEAETNVFVNGGTFSVGTTNNTAPVALDSQITVGSTTANDIVGYNMNVIDGGSNHRAHLFLDDANGLYGLTSASSVGNLEFVVKQASAEFLRIDSAGNVGIATNNPSQKLEVDGAILIKDSNTVGTLYLTNTSVGIKRSNAVDTTNSRDIEVFTDGAGANIVFSTNGAGSAEMVVTDSGEVGIGTDNPVVTLNVDSNAQNEIARFQGANAQLRIDNNTLNVLNLNSGGSGDSLALSTGSSEAMRIDSSGNVGIGTDNPAAELHINDATGLSAIRLTGGASGADNFQIMQGVTGVTNAGFSIYDIDATATRFVIDSSGNVGIGTDSPSSKLNIVDSSSATNGIIVQNASTGTGARSNVRLLSDAAQFDIYATGSNYSGVTGWADSGVLSTSSNASGGVKVNAQAGGITLQTSTTDRLKVNNDGSITFNSAYTFPTADGTNGQVLQTDGSGNLSFAAAGGGTITSATNMSDNRILTASGSTTINGETNLTFGASGNQLILRGSTSAPPIFRIDDYGTGSTALGKYGELRHESGTTTLTARNGSSNGVVNFKGFNGSAFTTYGGFDSDGNFEIGTTDIIDASRNMSNIGTISSGVISIGTDSGDPFNTNAKIKIQDSGTAYIQIKTGTSNFGGLLIGDTADDFAGGFIYDNNGDVLRLYSNDNVTLELDDNYDVNVYQGALKIGGTEVITSSANLTNIGTITSTGLVKIDANGTVNTLHIHDDSTIGQPGMIVTNTGSQPTSTQTLYAKQYGSGITGSLFGQTLGGKAFIGTEGSASGGLLIGTATADSVWIGTNNTAALTINSSQNATFAGSVQATSFSDGTISGITFVDEDNMASNSATKVPTQQSVKAYVDANAGSGTTINNNANNRVITGSDTANTLEAETNVFINGGNFSVGTTNNTAPVALDSQITVGSTTANDIVGYNMNVIDGGSNHKAHLFLDDLNGIFGLASASSVGNLAFVIKQASTEFLRIDTSGDSTFSGNISLGDNKKVVFGTGSDFDAYYNGTNLRIEGTGNLQVGASSGFNFSTGYGVGAQTYMEGDYSNGVKLNQGGATKLQTVSGGVNVTGTLNATGDVVAYYSSDERLKDNITVIDSALNKVTQIRGVEFDWNNKQNTYEGHDIGVIAQEVEKVVPELVKDRDDGYKAVDYQKLTALLIEAVKELKEEVEELKSKLQQ